MPAPPPRRDRRRQVRGQAHAGSVRVRRRGRAGARPGQAAQRGVGRRRRPLGWKPSLGGGVPGSSVDVVASRARRVPQNTRKEDGTWLWLKRRWSPRRRRRLKRKPHPVRIWSERLGGPSKRGLPGQPRRTPGPPLPLARRRPLLRPRPRAADRLLSGRAQRRPRRRVPRVRRGPLPVPPREPRSPRHRQTGPQAPRRRPVNGQPPTGHRRRPPRQRRRGAAPRRTPPPPRDPARTKHHGQITR